MLAVRQHGVFTLAQLTTVGLSAAAVHKRAATGRLYRLNRGVYSLAPPSLISSRGRYMAAVLASGADSVLSHRSAADLHGLRRTDRGRIDVTIPRRTPLKVDGVDIHRSLTLTKADLTTVDTIPCTSIARTLLDLASVAPRRAVERAFDQGEALEVLNLRELNAVLDRNNHTRGGRVIKAILADYNIGPPTESELEEIFYTASRDADIGPPERQVWIDPGDGEPAVRADFVWRKQRLVVETDGGRYHRTRRAFESDRRRDQRLLLAGWRVIRITWRQLKFERPRITALIARALRQPA